MKTNLPYHQIIHERAKNTSGPIVCMFYNTKVRIFCDSLYGTNVIAEFLQKPYKGDRGTINIEKCTPCSLWKK